jgi:GNAT superfamily N-acetyltransferase
VPSSDATGPRVMAGDPPPPPDPGAGPAAVTRVAPAVTHPLRARVLRPGRPVAHARLAADDHPDAAAFAAIDRAGTVVGAAIVCPDPCPWRPDHDGAWRLRAMATDPAWRRRGIGAQVVAAVLAHVRAAGGTLVWCQARVTARRFYERAGFAAHGDEWVDPEIGPHIGMWRDV